MVSMVENWRQLPSRYGPYQVSDLGNIRSLKGGRHSYGSNNPHVLQKAHNRRGYANVKMAGSGGVTYTREVHVLVAEAFIGPRPEGMEVCHANGIPGDNRLSSLRYDTKLENMRDITRHGNGNGGEWNRGATLSNAQVTEIVEALHEGIAHRRLAELYGVQPDVIGKISRFERWRSIPRPWGEGPHPSHRPSAKRSRQTRG